MASPQPRDGTRKDSRQARLAAGMLLLRERAARADIDQSARAATAQVGDDIGRRRSQGRAAALAAIVVAARALAPRIQADIARNRQAARAAASTRLGAELGAAGVALAAMGPTHAARAHEDDALAESAAASLAAQWRTILMASVLRAARKDEDAATALRKAAPAMDCRVERTAATEIAYAYNDEHARALEEAQQREPGLFAGIQIVRVWSAVLDRRTCIECADRDGRVVEGDDPPLHPLCRCVSVAMTFSEAQSLAA